MSSSKTKSPKKPTLKSQIETLEVSLDIKEEMRAITPGNYTGI